MLKRLIPTSLFSRFFLIIITPTILVQIVATYIFYERHWNAVSSYMISSLVGEIVTISEILENKIIKDKSPTIQEIKENLGLKISFWYEHTITKKNKNLIAEFHSLYSELKQKTDHEFDINYINDRSDIRVDLQLENGLLSVVFSRKRVDTPTTYIFIFWMTGSATFMLVLTLIFSRNQIKSITRLASAAEKFGKGQQIDDFKPEGAHEVRKAAVAFLQMKSRIERQITKRTEMLACISHDLRTPLTRMKLQLAMLKKSEEIIEMEQDIIEMEKMIQSYLDFAKGEGKEISTDIEISELMKVIIDSFKYHASNIIITSIANKILPLKINAFKRAIINLIDNAIRYATNIEISINLHKENIIINIEDDGPGIPIDKRDLVFKPFYRIDASRNTSTGGVGLGMSIARDIINSHGGEIILLDSNKLGGLLIRIYLPI